MPTMLLDVETVARYKKRIAELEHKVTELSDEAFNYAEQIHEIEQQLAEAQGELEQCLDCCKVVGALEQQLAEAQAKYQDLLYQVAEKIPDESRHDTAKRYIQERENRQQDPEAASVEVE